MREGVIRELNYVGLELPFVLEGSLLRLRVDLAEPSYPLPDDVPERLYFACKRKQYASLKEHGIARAHRRYVPVAADKELALRLGKRRDPEPILVEIRAAKAHAEGELIRWAGAELYLVESVSARHLIFPLIRAEQRATLTVRKKNEAKPPRPDLPTSAGSFFVDAHQLQTTHSPAKNGVDKGNKQKGRKKDDWKREAKKERHKRTL